MSPIEQFEDFEDFCQWYQDLVPEEQLNLEEAATIYFNHLEYFEDFDYVI